MAFNYSKAVTDAEAKYGIPDGIYERMVSAESSGNPTATSSKGAYGYAQLMPAAAADMGVDRFDPAQNIDGGAHYLKTLYDRFGDWDSAVAHYNAGPSGNINNPETRAYLKRVTGHTMADPTSTMPVPTGMIDPKTQARFDAAETRAMAEADKASHEETLALQDQRVGMQRIMADQEAADRQPLPMPPMLQKLPDPPNQQDYIKSPVRSLQQFLPMLAVLGGLHMRNGALASMKAATGAMKAQARNDQEALTRANDEWHQATENMLKTYEAQRTQFEEIIQNRQLSTQERLGELQALANMTGNAEDLAAVKAGDLNRLYQSWQMRDAAAKQVWMIYNQAQQQQFERERIAEQHRHNIISEGMSGGPQGVAYRAKVQELMNANPNMTQEEAEDQAFKSVSRDKQGNLPEKVAQGYRQSIQADKRTQAWQNEAQFVQALHDVDPSKMDEGPTQKLVIDAFNRLATNQAARKFLIDAGDQGLLNKADMIGKQLLSTKGPVMGTALAKRYYEAAQKMAETIGNPYDEALAENAMKMDQNGYSPTIAIDREAVDRIINKGLYTPSARVAEELGGVAPQPAAASPTAAKFKLTPDIKAQYDQAAKNGHAAEAKRRLAEAGYDVSGLS